MLEAALLLEPHSVRRETALVTVKCLLSIRKPTRLQHVSGLMLQNPRVLSNGAQPDAMSGKLKAAVTIQFAETKLAITNGHVGG